MLNHNLCTVCVEPISDPICRSCYINQAEILLNDLKLHKAFDEFILIKIKNKFPVETLNDEKCILCERDDVTICRFCFSLILTDTLRELNFSEEVIENFGYNQMHEENSVGKESGLKVETIFKNLLRKESS